MKILVIRFSSIGDIVLTTPVLRCLKKQLSAEIHFLTKQAFRNILDNNPNVDKVFSIQKKPAEVIGALRAEQYDYIIDLHHNLRSLQVKRSLHTKSFAFDKLNFKKWLLVNWKINRLPDIHIVDRYLHTVAPLGIHNDKQGLDYFIPENDEINLSSFFAQFPSVRFHSQYIAFVIGAAHATKRLPDDMIASICHKIKIPVVLLGGPDDATRGELIATAGPHVINTCGQLNLNQSASLVRQAHKVITHDTGLMHIAAAFHKDIISVWGNTVPEFGMYPYYPEGIEGNTTVEVKNLSCRPCSKIGYDHCPKGHFRCMRDIDMAMVAALSEMDTTMGR